MGVTARCVLCRAPAESKAVMSLALQYQYLGEYDHLIRIDIDSRGVLTKQIGNYKSQAPVTKQLSPEFVGLLEKVLNNLDGHMSANTDLPQKEFVATLRYGNDHNSKTLQWYGPAINQDPYLHKLIELLISQ